VTKRLDPRDDSGTILVLVLGFTAVLLMLVGVVLSVSSVVLAKRALASATDGAAVAAAQELDLAVLYERGLGQTIPLSREQVREAVERYQLRVQGAQPGIDLVGDVSSDGTTALVQGVRQVSLPFGQLLGFRPVEVQAEARARAPTGP
jgi:hypothetical protein